MYTTIRIDGRRYKADLNQPIDISIPLRTGPGTVNCFYAPPMETEPVVEGNFIGSTAKGGPLNFLNVRLNPHGNGTHTECVGHIARPDDFKREHFDLFTINQSLTKFHFSAKLVTLFPLKQSNGDRIITRQQMEEVLLPGEVDALIVRTMPNDDRKLHTSYSGSNPPYLKADAAEYLVACNIKHLLIDLPSVDREHDGGQLQAHRAFWSYPEIDRRDCTITELVFVKNEVKDGLYLVNLQIASFEIDVSPSKPVIYRLEKV